MKRYALKFKSSLNREWLGCVLYETYESAFTHGIEVVQGIEGLTFSVAVFKEIKYIHKEVKE